MSSTKSRAKGSLERILIVENSFHLGVGLLIAKLFRSEANTHVDSPRHANALDVAIHIREQIPDQVIMFSSNRANPVLVKEGIVSLLCGLGRIGLISL